MKHIKNIDIHKMDKTQIEKIVEKYTSKGWKLVNEWELSVHQWITFAWTDEDEPPEV